MQLITEGKLYLINNGPYIAIAVSETTEKSKQIFINKILNYLWVLNENPIRFNTNAFDGYFTMPLEQLHRIIKIAFLLEYYDKRIYQNLDKEKLEKQAESDAEIFIKSVPKIKKTLTSILNNVEYQTYETNLSYQKYE
jgi:hypothetical protein